MSFHNLRLASFILLFTFFSNQTLSAAPSSLAPSSVIHPEVTCLFERESSFQDSLRQIKNIINPVSYYKTLYQSVTQSLNGLGFKQVLGKIIDYAGKQFISELTGQQIDKQLEKTKMNTFLKTVLSTVASAGIEGLFARPQESAITVHESRPESPRAPPAGLAGILQSLTGALSSASGLVSSALKDAAGKIKSANAAVSVVWYISCTTKNSN